MITTSEYAQVRLSERNLKQSTIRSYLNTLKELGIADMPMEQCTQAFLFQRLQQVLTVSTRNRHSIALRTSLGVSVPLYRAQKRHYELPSMADLNQCFRHTEFRPYAYSMLYAGMRLGESIIKQRIDNNVITIDRQINGAHELTTAKTCGPVYVPEWFADEYRAFEPKYAYSTVAFGIKQAGKVLGLSLNPHLLRKKFATELANAGTPPEILKNQMRHSSLRTTLEFYTQHSETDYQEMITKTFGENRA